MSDATQCHLGIPSTESALCRLGPPLGWDRLPAQCSLTLSSRPAPVTVARRPVDDGKRLGAPRLEVA